MKILITTGLGKNDVGGPFQYAHNLEKAFKSLGHEAVVAQFSTVEKGLWGVWPRALWADVILILDTFSVGFPSVLAAKILRKKSLIRVGGDFLWSAYVNRTGNFLTLRDFYRNVPELNLKERLIFSITRWTLRNVDLLAFNTDWQRKIWSSYYGIPESKTSVVRNFIPSKRSEAPAHKKNLVWAGRLTPEKNIEMLKKFEVDIITREPHNKVLEKLKEAYLAVSFALTDVCPNFILEAVSFNKPFIMTRETGLDEIFPKGGIFVDPSNEEEIRLAIDFMKNEANYNKFVEELKRSDLTHSWRDIANEFITIWKKL